MDRLAHIATGIAAGSWFASAMAGELWAAAMWLTGAAFFVLSAVYALRANKS